MRAFDTDVLVEILAGNPIYVRRAASVPLDEQVVPVVVVEEILRARLNAIRQAEAGKGKLSISQAYEMLARSLVELRRLPYLPYRESANDLFREWRSRGIRVATHDLRIAAICVDIRATLICATGKTLIECMDLMLNIGSKVAKNSCRTPTLMPTWRADRRGRFGFRFGTAVAIVLPMPSSGHRRRNDGAEERGDHRRHASNADGQHREPQLHVRRQVPSQPERLPWFNLRLLQE